MGDAQQGKFEQCNQDVCVNILGTNVNVLTFPEAEAKLGNKVDEKAACIFSSANVYSIMLGNDDPSFQAMVNDANVVLPDGMPLVWVSRLLGHPNAERIHGDDLMLACFGKYLGWRHFFIGGRVGQAQKVIATLQRSFPGIRIAGSHETPERPISEIENACLINEIHTADPDIIWVGMGDASARLLDARKYSLYTLPDGWCWKFVRYIGWLHPSGAIVDKEDGVTMAFQVAPGAAQTIEKISIL